MSTSLLLERLTRWAPCVVDPDDEDGPVFQGYLTDPAGAWVRYEDLAEMCQEIRILPPPRTLDLDGAMALMQRIAREAGFACHIDLHVPRADRKQTANSRQLSEAEGSRQQTADSSKEQAQSPAPKAQSGSSPSSKAKQRRKKP